MKKSVIAIAVSMCLIFTLCATVYAKTDTDSGVLTGGYQCSAYLNVHDSSYSAYAETTADRGLDSNPNDYISVTLSFVGWNSSNDATYPTTPGYPNYNVGPNYTTARISATGENPDSVSASHYVQRGAYGWSGSTSVSYRPQITYHPTSST